MKNFNALEFTPNDKSIITDKDGSTWKVNRVGGEGESTHYICSETYHHIDCRALLKRYMEAVINHESVSFADNNVGNNLTLDDIKLLEVIEKEIMGENNMP